MNRILLVSLLFVFLSACAAGGHMMTMNSFYDIPVGATKEDVIISVGKPYAIHPMKDGVVEYEYIERFKVGRRNVNSRHYFLVIKDGKVISKRVEQSSPLPFTFDSYEMQTTQREIGSQ